MPCRSFPKMLAFRHAAYILYEDSYYRIIALLAVFVGIMGVIVFAYPRILAHIPGTIQAPTWQPAFPSQCIFLLRHVPGQGAGKIEFESAPHRLFSVGRISRLRFRV